MEIKEFIGTIAAILTVSSSVPQIVKLFKTKKADDISYLMYFVLIVGIILWLIYGFLIQNIIIIFANIVALIFSLTIYCLKFCYRNKDL